MDRQEAAQAFRIYKRKYRGNGGKPIPVYDVIHLDLKEAADEAGIELYHEMDVFRRLIFEFLPTRGGEAEIEDVFDWIGEKLRPNLTATDWEPVDGGRIPRWKKQIHSARHTMNRKGHITGIAGKTWALTDKGREEAEKVEREG